MKYIYQGTTEVFNRTLDVTDLVTVVVAQLRRDMSELVISARDVGLIKPVEPWDKG